MQARKNTLHKRSCLLAFILHLFCNVFFFFNVVKTCIFVKNKVKRCKINREIKNNIQLLNGLK